MRHILGEIDILGMQVPEDVRDRYHSDLKQALDAWMETPTDEATAAWVFWFLFDLWNKRVVDDREGVELVHLDAIETLLYKRLRNEMAEGAEYARTDTCYQYAAMSLVYLLDALDQPWAERTCELRDRVRQLAQAGVHAKEDSHEREELAGAYQALMAATRLQLYEAAARDRRFEDALEHLAVAAAGGHLLGRYPWVLGHADPLLAMSAFESLWDNKQDVRDWDKLGSICDLVRMAYDSFIASHDFEEEAVVWKGEEMATREFWRYAQGLCTSQMSISEYRKLRQKDLEHESEKRLATYFFRDTWSTLPQHIRERLTSVDCILFSEERLDMGGVIENLWSLSKTLIRSILWDPFVHRREAESWHAKQTEKAELWFATRVKSLAERDHEPTAKDFWDMSQLDSFQRFLRRVYPGADVGFLMQELPQAFQYLNDKRTPIAHRGERSTTVTRDDVMPLYERFMGVDCHGVLPHLARLLVETQGNTKPSSH